MTGGERGSGSLMTAFGVVLFGVVAAVVVLVGSGLAAAQRVRQAADLVAVSAAAASADGGDACAAAARIAAANQVELRGCEAAGDLLDFAVTVTVAAPADSLPGRLGFVTRSYAGWVLS